MRWKVGSLPLGATLALALACSETTAPGLDGTLPASGGATTGSGGALTSSGGTQSASGGANPGSGGALDGGGGALTSSGGGPTGGATSSGGTSSGGADGTGGADSAGSPGCGTQSPLTSGTFTIDAAGTEREYVLDVPDDYDTNQPYRLVFVWHPLGGSASQIVDQGYSGLESRSAGSAILVAPDGLVGMAAGITGQGWYNADGNDMEFLGAMLDHFESNLCIDQDRIFSTGFSFGGMMSYALGFEYGDVFRALAPSSGNRVATPHQEITTGPIAIMGLHGDMDDFVLTSDGRLAMDEYVARNHCGTETQPVDPSPCVAYQGCDLPTIWCEYPGAHMPWSGAPDAIWDFFEQF